MSAKLTFTGLRELTVDLRTLPAHLADEASTLVVAHANSAAMQVRSEYHRGPTGNLIRGVVVVTRRRQGPVALAVVKSRAPHVFWYEKGTKTRETKDGFNRGAAPAHNVFNPIVDAEQAALEADVRALLQREGLKVIG